MLCCANLNPRNKICFEIEMKRNCADNELFLEIRIMSTCIGELDLSNSDPIFISIEIEENLS